MHRITLKVFASDCKSSEPHVFQAPPGRQFTPAGANDMVIRFLGQLAHKFPTTSFRVVTIGAGQYNVIPIPETSAHA